ncbi:MAG TPA: SDR family oxidoreductase [Ramlibacter sp.]|nr:SDR family oxidoreductase [Ramlibacter sp.]
MSANSWLHPQAFAGRVAIVVGGASGIGASVCATLAAHGCQVVVADRNVEAAARVSEQALGAGGAATHAQLDVTQPQTVLAGVDAAVAWGRRLDFVVHCAGHTIPGELATLPLEDWHATMDVNFHGPFHVARAAYPHLKRQVGSSIVNVGSVASQGAYPGGGAYAASKAALLVLTKQLAVEWAPDGIRVNSVSPGPTRTPLLDSFQSEETKRARARKVPLQRIGEPTELADAICYLLSPGASFITGHEVLVDGGISQTLMNGTAAWVEKRAAA